MRRWLRFLVVIISTFVISASAADAAEKKKDKDKKDCVYCQKYEKLKDWPESERPIAFIYEEFDYPKGMFSKQSNKDSKSRQGMTGKKVFQRFVKGKGQLNKYQHLMIRDMAYFEALFNEMLNGTNSCAPYTDNLSYAYRLAASPSTSGGLEYACPSGPVTPS